MPLFRKRTAFTQNQHRQLRKAGDFGGDRAKHPPACDSGQAVATHDNDIHVLIGCHRKNAGRNETNGNEGLNREAA
jgi:hypothetical protein